MREEDPTHQGAPLAFSPGEVFLYWGIEVTVVGGVLSKGKILVRNPYGDEFGARPFELSKPSVGSKGT